MVHTDTILQLYTVTLHGMYIKYTFICNSYHIEPSFYLWIYCVCLYRFILLLCVSDRFVFFIY